MKKTLGAVLCVFMAAHAPLCAQDLNSLFDQVEFTFGGYGTAGAAVANTNDAEFVRGQESAGASKHVVENVDSNLGVQASARFTPWLSATVQVLDDNDDLTPLVAWAYLKIQPLTNLDIKLGRLEMPLFAVSDSRDINYANIWVRPPNDVYALGNIEELNGGEVTGRVNIGASILSLSAYTGTSRNAFSLQGDDTLADYRSKDVGGGEVRWDIDSVTVRGSYTTSITEIAPGVTDRYTFSAVGAMYDHDSVVAQAEYVWRKSAENPQLLNSIGWYVFGGYRFGKVVPYASYGASRKLLPEDPDNAITYNESTFSLGVRWDAFQQADIKVQFDRIDPKGTPGVSFNYQTPSFGSSIVNVASVTVDFIFGG